MLKDICSKEQLQKLYYDGLDQQSIAKLYGVSTTTICRLMKIYEIPVRTQSEIDKIIYPYDLNSPIKKCSSCQEFKNKNECFSKKASSRDTYNSICRSCSNTYQAHQREQKKLMILSEEDIIKNKLEDLYWGAKHRANKHNLPFTLPKQWILDKYYNQNGCCALTGIKFQFTILNSKRNPFGPSLDQIKAGQGYTLENVRLICVIANLALSDFGIDNFKFMVENFISYEKKQAQIEKKEKK